MTSLIWYKCIYKPRLAKKTRPPKKVKKGRPSLNEVAIKKEEPRTKPKKLESPSEPPLKQTTKKSEAPKKSKKEEDDTPKDIPRRKSRGKKPKAPKVEKVGGLFGF